MRLAIASSKVRVDTTLINTFPWPPESVGRAGLPYSACRTHPHMPHWQPAGPCAL